MESRLKNSQVIVLASVPAVIFHYSWLPGWFALVSLAIWGYLLFFSTSRLALLPRYVSGLVGLLALASVASHFGAKYSLDMCVAVLAAMLVIKPLETRTKRDCQVTLFIAFFFNFVSLFYFTSLFATVYLFSSMLLIMAALYFVESEGADLRIGVRLVWRILLQALPLTLLLFFVFPRLQVSLWSLSTGDRGRSGFTDSFRIDDIKNLSLNNDPAFRAHFDGPIPERSRLYWRGIVYGKFDGIYWSKGRDLPKRNYRPHGSQFVKYRVVLEPHDSKWLFGLDLPRAWDGQTIYTDHTFRARSEIRDTFHYEAISVLDAAPGADDCGAAENLYLPPGFNDESRELARSWRVKSDRPAEIVRSALQFFRQNNFVYSLETPALSRDSIDDFLFRTRSGFCEHYASALAFLLRAADVPARVVGGYLGGEENPAGNYLIVSQSDAHVWVEFWNNEHWQRVDATAVIAPARITQGLRGAIPESEIPFLANERRFGRLYQLWKLFYLRIDAINFAWSTWVEGYSLKTQLSFLKSLGLDARKRSTTILLIGVATLFFLLTVWLAVRGINRRSLPRPDKITLAYDRLLQQLARRGIVKPGYMGPEEFARIISARHSDVTPAVRGLFEDYSRLRFGRIDLTERSELEQRFILGSTGIKFN